MYYDLQGIKLCVFLTFLQKFCLIFWKVYKNSYSQSNRLNDSNFDIGPDWHSLELCRFRSVSVCVFTWQAAWHWWVVDVCSKIATSDDAMCTHSILTIEVFQYQKLLCIQRHSRFLMTFALSAPRALCSFQRWQHIELVHADKSKLFDINLCLTSYNKWASKQCLPLRSNKSCMFI